MKSGIGTQTNVMRVYDEDAGKELPGVVAVQLPALEVMTNTFKGAGVGGEINVPAPGMLTPQVATISFPKGYGHISRFYALAKTGTLDLRADDVVNQTDNHTIGHIPEKWILKGPVTKFDPGKLEQAATGDGSLEMQVWYMHHWLDGEDVLEWDVYKQIFKVNGEDLLEESRQNVMP